jgi:enamine deaminase RidA (YjgF/YER057c/UK114 family)
LPAISARLAELGHTLPAPLKVPAGITLPFAFVNVRGERAFVSGHGPQEIDGSVSGPFGQVGAAVTLEEGFLLAQKTGLAILGSLERELGDLDRIAGWGRVFGMVNAPPGFTQTPAVINGFSKLILDVFGPDVGRHARSAIGVSTLPFDMAVEIEAEVLIRP